MSLNLVGKSRYRKEKKEMPFFQTCLKSGSIQDPLYLYMVLNDVEKIMKLYFYQSQETKEKGKELRDLFSSFIVSSSKKKKKQTKEKLNTYKRVGTCFIKSSLLTDLFTFSVRKPVFHATCQFIVLYREHVAEIHMDIPYKYVGQSFIEQLKQLDCFTMDENKEWCHPRIHMIRKDQVISVKEAKELLEKPTETKNHDESPVVPVETSPFVESFLKQEEEKKHEP